MTTTEQLSTELIKHTGELAALAESLKSAHRRIDENDHIIEGIYKLAANVEGLAIQVKLLTESVESSIGRLESSLKTQGERISQLEKEPAEKWKALVGQIISLTAAALFGLLISKLIQ